jgi:hypothetical protein
MMDREGMIPQGPEAGKYLCEEISVVDQSVFSIAGSEVVGDGVSE